MRPTSHPQLLQTALVRAALPGNSSPAAFVSNAVHVAQDVFLAFGCASCDGRREVSKSITSSGQIGHLGAGSDEAPPP